MSAKDNSTGKSSNIQIKNDKGRLSKEEIEKMLRDAEKYKHEDEQQREKVAAKNKLEAYVFSLKQAINDVKSINSSDKKLIEDACSKELKWLESNQSAEKDEFEFHYNELSRKCSPVMARIHRNETNKNGPTVEEVE